MDSAGKLDFLERRLTILEREVFDLKGLLAHVQLGPPPAKRIAIECDAPGFAASQAYEVERAGSQKAFCWIGSPETVQLKLPFAPVVHSVCRIFLKKHESISFDRLKLFVNDAPTEYRVVKQDEYDAMVFSVQASARPHVEAAFQGVDSIRPVDVGDGVDNRLLAFRFYGAEIEYDDEKNESTESPQ